MTNIFVIDDDVANLCLLSDLLKQQGFVVRSFQEGRTALTAARNAPPDLILLDILMPDMDGYDVCQQLKADERTREIPVIFLSALHETFDKVKAFASGGVDYIAKPFQVEEVVARINTHLALRRLQQQFQQQNSLLHEQNERFQRLSEATFEGILIADHGRILDVNRRLASMFGYQQTELLNNDVLTLFGPEKRELARACLNAEDSYPYETEGIRKDGAREPVEIQCKTMPYEGREAQIIAVRDLSWRQALEQEKYALISACIPDHYKFGSLVGKSPVMQAIYHEIVNAAASESNVLICGESGAGKELAARAIHQRSKRQEQPFVEVNCGAVPDNLFEREFFGHRKGAFTGADRDQPGYFDHARGGTLFLDEIGELPPPLQVKLLRALEEKAYIPLGDTHSRNMDVRIIAATNRDLAAALEQGAIRKDFFYRIHVITFTLPPLRERVEDIPLLVDHFLRQEGDDRTCATLPRHLMTALCTYHWPGNVRQLQNVLQRYLAGQPLEFIGDALQLPEKASVGGQEFDLSGLSFHEAIEAFEKHLIAHALAQNAGHQANTCAMLRIPPKTLYRKMRKYGLKSAKEDV